MRWFWVVLISVGAAAEIYALLRHNWSGTLSWQVWRLHDSLAGTVFLWSIWSWLTWHWVVEPVFRGGTAMGKDDSVAILLGALSGLLVRLRRK